MKVFYFTGTGNSLAVASIIGGELISIPRALEENKTEFTDDAIGFVFPCYGLGVPRMVLRFLKNTSLKADYFFAVLTCGGFAGAALQMFREEAEKQGISIRYMENIVMVDNQKIMADAEPERAKINAPEITEHIRHTAEEIHSRTVKLPGYPVELTMATQMAYADFEKEYLDSADEKYELCLDQCTQCGLCSKVCPAGNIIIQDGPLFQHHCEGCYACIHICPNKVIKTKYVDHEGFDPTAAHDGPPPVIITEDNGERYLNPNVKVKEIISSNRRTIQ